jgi:ceramide glucosyltransferase
MPALARELAEDAAATKIVRAAGLRVRLADRPFAQPLGRRSLVEVWRRQVRWARLRRASFPGFYALEIFTSGLLPLFAATGVCLAWDLPLAIVPAAGTVWYGAEAVLAYGAGWSLTVRSPLVWMLRDVMLPVLWVSGWCGRRFVWRGTGMRTGETQIRPSGR